MRQVTVTITDSDGQPIDGAHQHEHFIACLYRHMRNELGSEFQAFPAMTAINRAVQDIFGPGASFRLNSKYTPPLVETIGHAQ